MIVKLEKVVNYKDIGFDFKLRPDSLVSFFQEIAIHHSDMVGYDAETLKDMGVAWVLNKLYVDIAEYPVLGDSITVITWSSGISGVKAFREFIIRSGGTEAVRAVSMWTLLDITTKRIKRIPSYLSEAYETESSQATSFPIASYKVDKNPGDEEGLLQTVRFSDFDTNMHMNNTAYVNILDTALKRYIGKNVEINEFFINFQKEVGFDVEKLTVKFSRQDTNVLYSINDAKNICSKGFVRV
ncbi:acyl-[acyl-carrier-protein] thioesterase [Flexistipes sinusarabici]|nr:acyl-ACP thioesterase domain-containing protein [Flexistipes sinusarabici]